MDDKPDASAEERVLRICPIYSTLGAMKHDDPPCPFCKMVVPVIRAAVEAEQRRCEMEANDAVFAALSDEVPDHFDGEGRRDGYTFSAMARIATKVVLAIRGGDDG